MLSLSIVTRTKFKKRTKGLDPTQNIEVMIYDLDNEIVKDLEFSAKTSVLTILVSL